MLIAWQPELIRPISSRSRPASSNSRSAAARIFFEVFDTAAQIVADHVRPALDAGGCGDVIADRKMADDVADAALDAFGRSVVRDTVHLLLLAAARGSIRVH